MASFPTEPIPNQDRIFFRVHDRFIEAGQIQPSCFRQQASADGSARSMSTDWEKYSSPAACRQRARNPVENSIVSFIKGEITQINGVSVAHAPVANNRAHTDVCWDNKNKAVVRNRLMNCYKPVIRSQAFTGK